MLLNNLLITLALQYLDTPYIWGGQDLNGLDCSGLVVKVLQEAGLLNKNQDLTAHGLYRYFSKKLKKTPSKIKPNSLLFFGKSTRFISHVAIAINNEYMIEAGGGNRSTKSISDAIKRNARVRISRINHRRDLLTVLYLGR